MVFLSSRSPFTRVSSPLLVSSLLQKPQPSIEKPLSNASFPLMCAGYTVCYPTQTPTDYTRPQPKIHLAITNTASAPLSSSRRVLGQPLLWSTSSLAPLHPLRHQLVRPLCCVHSTPRAIDSLHLCAGFSLLRAVAQSTSSLALLYPLRHRLDRPLRWVFSTCAI
jgi:hypothetical protein